MTTLATMVAEVRSMLSGSLSDELTTLASAYVPGSGILDFQYPKRGLAPGATLSAGLNTFYVLEVATQGAQAVVLASYDGGPDEAVPLGGIVRIKPRFTNWAIFRELSQEFRTLSSPAVGLYSAQWFDAPVDWAYGTYDLPAVYGEPIRMIRARAQLSGSDQWTAIANAEWQPEQRIVRAFDLMGGAVNVEFTFAMPFGAPASLADSIVDLGMDESMADIPTLGACASLSLSGESRRIQPFSQGDSRRSEEVPVGASASISREFARAYQQRIDAEATRLVATYGYYSQVPISGDGRSSNQTGALFL